MTAGAPHGAEDRVDERGFGVDVGYAPGAQFAARGVHEPRIAPDVYWSSAAPRRNAISRLFVALQNVAFRAMCKEFRTFGHPPAAMLDLLPAHGLDPAYADKQLVREVTGLAR